MFEEEWLETPLRGRADVAGDAIRSLGAAGAGGSNFLSKTNSTSADDDKELPTGITSRSVVRLMRTVVSCIAE